MLEQVHLYLLGLPAFLSYLSIGAILMLVYITLYNLLTPINEWELIKQNDIAAAIAFSGSLGGFVIPLSSAITNAQSYIECILWGGVALIVQLAAFAAVRVFLPKLPERIKQGEVSSGLVLSVISLASGLLISASMTF